MALDYRAFGAEQADADRRMSLIGFSAIYFAGAISGAFWVMIIVWIFF